MEYSTAEMTCILKVNTQCEECKVKVMNVLKNIRGVYNITIDGDQGTVKVTGRVNPSTLLGVLEKYGRHAEVKFIKFDGEVVQRSPHYYGRDYGYGYDPYAMEGSYPPLLGCPQHQWYPTSLSFNPPPPAPGPPPPPRPPPPLAPYHYQVAPPPPPPPYWGPPPPGPYGPSPLGPFWLPPPPSHGPRGGIQNKNVATEKNHCGIM